MCRLSRALRSEILSNNKFVLLQYNDQLTFEYYHLDQETPE